MAARLSGGWTRLEVVGDVEPVQLLVNKKTGKFGTLLVGDDATIRDHDTLADARAFIKEMQEAGAIDVVLAEEPYGDQVVQLKPLRVKKIGRDWVRMDGTRIYYKTLLMPDAAAAAAVEEKRAEHEAAKKTAVRLRDEAWEIVRGMRKLDDEG